MALLALVAAILAAAPTDRVVHRRAQHGLVRAELRYVARSDLSWTTAAVTIARRGRTVHRARLTGLTTASLRLVDLDGAGEREVLVEAYTGGAHCCWVLNAYGWDGRRYSRRHVDTGNAGYVLRDLGRGPAPEVVSGDNRFAYLFTAYAASSWPLRVYAYRGGSFAVVTRAFPAALREHERGLWADYTRTRRHRAEDVRGILAAWAADMCLLGRAREVGPALEAAWTRGELARGPGGVHGAAYIRALRRKLETFGYGRFP